MFEHLTAEQQNALLKALEKVELGDTLDKYILQTLLKYELAKQIDPAIRAGLGKLGGDTLKKMDTETQMLIALAYILGGIADDTRESIYRYLREGSESTIRAYGLTYVGNRARATYNEIAIQKEEERNGKSTKTTV